MDWSKFSKSLRDTERNKRNTGKEAINTILLADLTEEIEVMAKLSVDPHQNTITGMNWAAESTKFMERLFDMMAENVLSSEQLDILLDKLKNRVWIALGPREIYEFFSNRGDHIRQAQVNGFIANLYSLMPLDDKPHKFDRTDQFPYDIKKDMRQLLVSELFLRCVRQFYSAAKAHLGLNDDEFFIGKASLCQITLRATEYPKRYHIIVLKGKLRFDADEIVPVGKNKYYIEAVDESYFRKAGNQCWGDYCGVYGHSFEGMIPKISGANPWSAVQASNYKFRMANATSQMESAFYDDVLSASHLGQAGCTNKLFQDPKIFVLAHRIESVWLKFMRTNSRKINAHRNHYGGFYYSSDDDDHNPALDYDSDGKETDGRGHIW